MLVLLRFLFLFFFNDTATTEIYTLSLHDALPILRFASPPRWPARSCRRVLRRTPESDGCAGSRPAGTGRAADRKSTRLNSSHSQISYAVFCLKKKKKNITNAMNIHDSEHVRVYDR